MRLSEKQKQLITLYRKQNIGYGEIAKKMGLLKSTVTAYCHRHELGGFRAADTAPEQSQTLTQESSGASQQSVEPQTPEAGKTKRGKKEIHPTVTLVFAKEPNYKVVEEVKRMLLNADRRTDTDITWKKGK